MTGKLPDFFIIGAPKCGTTALSTYLSEHAQILFSNPKEPEYFAFDFSNRPVTKQNSYSKLFDSFESGQYLVAGEGSVCYLNSSVAVHEILTLAPKAKFIVMLRNPVELVYSLHSQLVFNLDEDLEDFETAWKSQDIRRTGKLIPRNTRDEKWLFYSDWGLLGTQIETLYARVQKEQIMVILFDDFVQNTRDQYEKVLDFLEVPYDGRSDFPPVNENKQITSWKLLSKTLALASKVILPLKELLGRSQGFGMHDWIKKRTSVSRDRPDLPPELFDELSGFFEKDVAKLSKLLDRDLSYWLLKHGNDF